MSIDILNIIIFHTNDLYIEVTVILKIIDSPWYFVPTEKFIYYGNENIVYYV